MNRQKQFREKTDILEKTCVSAVHDYAETTLEKENKMLKSNKKLFDTFKKLRVDLGHVPKLSLTTRTSAEIVVDYEDKC